MDLICLSSILIHTSLPAPSLARERLPDIKRGLLVVGNDARALPGVFAAVAYPGTRVTESAPQTERVPRQESMSLLIDFSLVCNYYVIPLLLAIRLFGSCRKVELPWTRGKNNYIFCQLGPIHTKLTWLNHIGEMCLVTCKRMQPLDFINGNPHYVVFFWSKQSLLRKYLVVDSMRSVGSRNSYVRKSGSRLVCPQS